MCKRKCLLCGTDSENRFVQDGISEYVCNKCIDEMEGTVSERAASIFHKMETPEDPLPGIDQYPGKCPECGTSLISMVNDMRAGCPECYITYGGLYEDADISIALSEDSDDELFSLEFQLAAAVRAERYEDAADLKAIMEKLK